MEPLERNLVMGIVGSGLLALTLVFGYEHYQSGKEKAAIAAANQDQQAATVARTQAVSHDEQAVKDQTTVKQDDTKAQTVAATVAQADANVARVRKALAPAPQPPATPGVPVSEPPASPVDLSPLVAAQSEEIEALKNQHALDLTQIADRDKLIGSLTLSRDAWHTSADQSSAEAVQLHAAIAAQEGLIRAAEFKGFLYGAALGGLAGGASVAYLKH